MVISEETKKEIIDYHELHGAGRRAISKVFGISEWKIRKILKDYKEDELKQFEDSELLSYSVDLELKNQLLRDKNRVERKIRDEYRKTNHVVEYINELIDLIPKIKITEDKPDRVISDENSIGILQISDAHFNEFIDLDSNTYNFDIASKRLKKFVIKAKKYFKINNIKKVVVALSGDMINSDRRADEKITMITSRAKATYFASLILEKVILDLHSEFDVSVAYVVGNESRSFEVGESDVIVSDNYDLTIVSLLKVMFKDTNVKFLKSNLIDCVLNVNNKNVLIIHGDRIGQNNLQKSIQELKGRYLTQGIRIDYAIFGHIHESHIADYYARSGSLCGSNGYSQERLNFGGRASQNIHIIDHNGEIDSIKIDLQNVENIDGYGWDENLNVDATTNNNYKDKIVKI